MAKKQRKKPVPQETVFKQRLRFFRLQAKKSQLQLAAASGIAKEYVSRLERGLALPSLAVATRIADALGISLDALADRKKRFAPLDPLQLNIVVNLPEDGIRLIHIVDTLMAKK